jgi:hypothetical protein
MILSPRLMRSKDIGRLFLEFPIFSILFLTPGPIIANLAHGHSGLPGLGARLSVNILYFVQLVFPAFSHVSVQRQMVPGWPSLCSNVVYQIATCIFGVAALLYGIARARRHALVSSSLLGGTGIEAMILILPGLGPSHRSVGDEAREGAIRL